MITGPARPEADRGTGELGSGQGAAFTPHLFKRASTEHLLCAEQQARLQGCRRSGEETLPLWVQGRREETSSDCTWTCKGNKQAP